MIGVRTHGGPGIGLGHVRRCLTLATALQKLNEPALFIIEDEANTQALIERSGFESCCVEAGRTEPQATLDIIRGRGLSVLIADSYDIDTPYLEAVRSHVKTVVALDDMADRALPVDVVVNAAIGVESSAYVHLTQARLLLGAPYCLLREEFARDPARSVRPTIDRILITVGGSDPQQLTARLIEWAQQVLPAAHIDAIIGPFFDWRPAGADPRLILHDDPANMRELMLGCDLALCSGGQTTLELAATGTPALAIQLADNQARNLAGLSHAGVLQVAGRGDDDDLAEHVKAGLAALVADPPRRGAMSAHGRALIDGCGAVRIAQAIIATARGG
jgi:UDP-2,4-diacetamido-2,4,6-trideoxy-beta-L-altropyranose hydrolase